jgi:hypothetical protein
LNSSCADPVVFCPLTCETPENPLSSPFHGFLHDPPHPRKNPVPTPLTRCFQASHPARPAHGPRLAAIAELCDNQQRILSLIAATPIATSGAVHGTGLLKPTGLIRQDKGMLP